MEIVKKKSPKYSPEVRERAVQMVHDHRGERESQRKMIAKIPPLAIRRSSYGEVPRRETFSSGRWHDRPICHSNGRLRVRTPRLNVRPATHVNDSLWPASVRSPARYQSDFSLLSHFERVIDLDPEVSDGTFELGMAWQKLNSAQILCPSIYQRRLGAPHPTLCRVSSVISNCTGR
jgi:transposase